MTLRWIVPWAAALAAAAPLAAQDTLSGAQVTALRARYQQQQIREIQIRGGTRLDSIRRRYDRRLQLIAPAGDTLDRSPYPLWYRAYLRDTYPGLPTSGPYQYPRVAAQLLEWMAQNQDLEIRSPGMPGRSARLDPSRAAGGAAPTAMAAVGSNLNISNVGEIHSESFIAVDPTNPNSLVASSNNISGSGRLKVFYTSDGGQSWNTTELPLNDGAAFHSDPAVAWSSTGMAWAATLGISTAGAIKVQMYRSADRGATWTFAGTVSTGTNNDKELIWVDPHSSSPHRDNVYVAWDVPGAGMRFARSTDGGTTWSAVASLSTDQAIGAHLTTGPAGELYVAWPDVGSRQIQVRKSTDGGATFGPVRVIATTTNAYEVSIPAMCQRKVLVYVAVGADRSSGPNAGHVYAVWTDHAGAGADPGCAGLTSAGNSSVFFSRSTDGGATWSAPSVIHTDPAQSDQFNPWMDVDPATGHVHVAFYDTRADANRRLARLYYIRSIDGGTTWVDETEVATAPTDESASGADANQYGDYNGLAVYQAVVHPSWTDRRTGVPGGNEQIFTSRIVLPAPQPPVQPPPVQPPPVQPPPVQPPVPATLDLVLDPDVKLSVGQTTTARATLTRNGSPVAGETILFTVGDAGIASVSSGSVATNPSGIAEVTVSGVGRGSTTITASGGGDLDMVTVRVPTLSTVAFVALAVVLGIVAFIRLRPRAEPA
jgi:hypothetical protein